MAAQSREFTPAELAQRIAQIKTLDRNVLQAGAGEVAAIRRLGEYLIETRSGIRRTWDAWCRENLPFGKSTTRRSMLVAEHWNVLKPLAPLGKSAVYELAEIAEKHPERLQGLNADSTVRGRRLRDLDCHEIKTVFNPTATAPPRPAARPPCDPIATLKRIKRTDPEAWGDLVDDLVALIGDGAAPQPARPQGVLTGATRNERAEELADKAQELLDSVDDVDDVGGKLSKDLKIKLMQITLVIWREVNRLPAFAQLPAGWKPSTGPVQGVVLRPT